MAILLHRIVRERLAVGRQDLEMVEARVHSGVSPDDFFVSSDFE